ncbi:hypothetical protein EV127DRAFT_414281 [Xylaria flabelliformis]|nr:hypothetical protein EV127DRAFT_414281 [Xylaria flabelliformis]
MATNPLAKRSFNRTELERVTQILSLEAIKIGNVLQGATRNEWDCLWEDVLSWIDGGLDENLDDDLDGDLNEELRRDLRHYKNLYPDIGHGALLTAHLWKRSEDKDMTFTGLSPIFIFLTIPDPIMDLRVAWRCLLCTLICEISNYMRHVRSTKLRECGVYGGQYIYRYFSRAGIERGGEDSDDIGALIELLSAFQHCDYDMEHTYVVVIDRMTRFSDCGDSDYSKAFFSALRKTLVRKMRAYILFIDEMLPAEGTPA